MVVAQLVEQLLPIPEARGSNPVIGKIYIEHLFATVNCIEKTKIKKKRSGLTHFLKNVSFRDFYFDANSIEYLYPNEPCSSP